MTQASTSIFDRDGQSSFPTAEAGKSFDLGGKTGILPKQRILAMAHRRMIQSAVPLDEGQIQPASLDLRLGHKAYRVRASFLPGRGTNVLDRIKDLTYAELDLTGGAVLERNCVYIIELLEHLDLPDSISALANPKSSTGRLDIFTRVIANEAEQFDFVPAGYQGKIYAEVCPRTFSIMARTGSRLSQLRFRKRGSNQDEHADFRLSDRELRERHEAAAIVDGAISARGGLLLSVHLAGAEEAQWAGFRAQTYTDVIDVDRVGAYSARDFWEPIPARPDRHLILDPHQFYILASKERMRVPSDLAAEMVPIDPSMGEFRAHYAGFFDPGFGDQASGPSARAVLEVRSHEVPFILEDGQFVGRLVFERMTEQPDSLYGQAGSTNNYQSQGLKLSKHFVAD